MKKLFCLFAAAVVFLIAASDACAQSNAQVFSKLKIRNFQIESIWPTSFSSVSGSVSAEVDNAGSGFSVSDIKGTIYKDGAPFVYGNINDVYIVKGHGKYKLSGNATLCSGVSLFSLLKLLSFDPKSYSVDASVKVKFENGKTETLSVTRLPVSEFLKM